MQSTIILLFVEDESMIYDLMASALEEGGYAVLWGENGRRAIALLEERAGEIAGVITDVQLGSGLNGWDVGHRAREFRPDIPVIYMTGDSAAEWSVNGVPNSLLLQKPFAPAQLVTAISDLLNRNG